MLARKEVINEIRKNNQFDAIVIGGGSSGLGIGVDLSNKGFRVLLLEEYDYAKGTSSRSTKLLHGGVRYLAQLNFSLIKDSLREKLALFNNAPHLTKDLKFLIPCKNYFEVAYYSAGLVVYGALAGFPKGQASTFISKKKLIEDYPNLKDEDLVGAIVYHDGVFDDARLALSLGETIFDNKSLALNYARATNFHKDSQSKINGVTFLDTENNEEISVYSNCVVNAAGIFADYVRALDKDDKEAVNKKLVQYAQGVHIVVERSKINSDYALLIPKTTDGRVLFTVPWHSHVLIGTTDTKIEKPSIEPKALEAEIDFILENINLQLENKITRSDVSSVYTGIRPLINTDSDSTAKVSREEKTTISSSNLVSIVGGKWTSYRRMSANVVKFLLEHNLLDATKADINKSTEHQLVHGYLSREEVEKLDPNMQVYGSKAKDVLSLNMQEKIHAKLPYTVAQIIYATNNEQAVTVDDILARRTRALFLDSKAAVEASEKVAKIMAKHLNKDDAWVALQVKNFKEIAQNYMLSPK